MTPSLWPVPQAYPLPGITNDQLIWFGRARPRAVLADDGGHVLGADAVGMKVQLHAPERPRSRALRRGERLSGAPGAPSARPAPGVPRQLRWCAPGVHHGQRRPTMPATMMATAWLAPRSV